MATLGSIEVPEDSPVLTKNETNIPIIQMAGNSDADLSADDEMSPNLLTRQVVFFTKTIAYFTTIHRKEDKWTRGLHSPSSSSIKSFDLQVANWRIESLGRDSESGSEEEFFDCQGNAQKTIIYH